MAAELAAQTLFRIGPLPLTNTLLHTFFVDFLILGFIFSLKRKITLIPGFLQNLSELVVETFYELATSISSKNAKIIFPWFMTFFVFILVANWTSLLPGFGTIGLRTKEGFVPLLRGAGSDLNFTLGLALVSAVATHVLAIRAVGIWEYLSRYFSLNPIFLFVGILELVGEITKIVSLSFRLFGNIFAGEVVLSTVSNIFAFILPLPFFSLEIIVGLVQALVFAILTMSFMAILMTPHNEGGEH